MNKLFFTKLLLVTAFSLIAVLAKSQKPNIIVFYTDDQGWADTSVPMIKDNDDTKSDFYQTPNLERMAKKGLVFSQAYSASPVCTPSRISFQFGKTPARLQNTTVYDILAITRNKKCQGEVTVHEMIKANDPEYKMAHFGKWGMHVRQEPG